MSDKKFINAYDDLMRHLYEIMDDTLHSVADALDLAKEKTSELGGLTQEEINEVSDFLMRDIEHAAQSSPTVSDDDSLSEWFKFDVDLIENFALEAFSSLADKTQLELAKIKNQAKKYHPYKSGDIAGPGTFICDKCGKQIAFKSTSKIPHCPKCDAESFSRS
ncbi:MAG: zinc ribbon-containing protein [Methylococcaceae bacterium]|nr:zinc ribbon-containing protein [Methylococcaceae bacterium]